MYVSLFPFKIWPLVNFVWADACGFALSGILFADSSAWSVTFIFTPIYLFFDGKLMVVYKY